MEYPFIATDDKDKDADFSFTTDGFFVIYVSNPPTEPFGDYSADSKFKR